MKKIAEEHIKVSDLKGDFGNPRKIKQQKREELKKSLEEFGDFGIILIDEEEVV